LVLRSTIVWAAAYRDWGTRPGKIVFFRCHFQPVEAVGVVVLSGV